LVAEKINAEKAIFCEQFMGFVQNRFPVRFRGGWRFWVARDENGSGFYVFFCCAGVLRVGRKLGVVASMEARRVSEGEAERIVDH
jgi:hypothetical protein